MGSESRHSYACGDCPVCGRHGGAYMSSSAWRPFEGLACSDACGLAAQADLQRMMGGRRFEAALALKWAAEAKLNAMKRRAVQRAGRAFARQAAIGRVNSEL